jgi:hypothetical protein
MSESTPYGTLGVSEDASFEEIQSAKQRLSQQYQGNTQVIESIEAAYDAIIMERLRLRKEGRIRVPERIRFPERAAESPAGKSPASVKLPPSWLQNLLDTPSSGDIFLPAAVFSGLAAAAIFSAAGDISFFALLLAVGGMASVYFLNRKERRFGRAVIITALTFIAGIALGFALAASNAIPLAGEQLACAATFCLFWLSTSFLR